MIILALTSSILFGVSVYLFVRSVGQYGNVKLERLIAADAQKYEMWSDSLFVEWTPAYALRIARIYWYVVVGAIGAALLALLFARLLLPILILPIVLWLAPQMYYKRRLERHLEEISQQLPESITIMVSSLRSGHSLSQAIIEISTKAPAPINKEFAVIANEHLFAGLSLDEALARARKRVDSETFNMFCTALIIHIDSGGDIIKVSDRISWAIRELLRLQKKLYTETSDIRAQEKIALVMTPLFFILVCFLHESIFNILVFTWTGNLLLFVVAAIQYVAYSWIRSIAKASV